MDARAELQCRDRRRVNVDQSQRRMVGHQVTPTAPAELPVTGLGLRKLAEKLRALRNPHILRLPEGEGIHRCCRPPPAGRAVAVAHGFGRALHFDLDRAAKALALIRCHDVRISLFDLRTVALCLSLSSYALWRRPE